MLLYILRRSFVNQKKAMALMTISIAVGTALAASLITISLEVKAKISRELRSFGANINVQPKIEGLADIAGQKRYLRSDDIVKTKTIFWRHNIIGVSPFLETNGTIAVSGKKEDVQIVGAWYEHELPLPGETGKFMAGIKTVSPWWYINGSWPLLKDEVLIGASLASKLALKPGDSLMLYSRTMKITGTIETGGPEDGQVFMDLGSLQEAQGLQGKISRLSVSALTTPMDEFAYKDPNTMSKAEYEKWYCTGYVTSIAKQIEEVFEGSSARPIWQVADTEGKVLDRLRLLIYLLCVVVVAASAIGVSTTMIMSLLRRTAEIGLMKALGADKSKIIGIFLTEGMIIGLAGGIFGYLLSLALSGYIGVQVFNSGLEQRAILVPIAMGNAIIIAIAGTILPIRKALDIKPVVVMKGVE